jgi:hypothetical protein
LFSLYASRRQDVEHQEVWASLERIFTMDPRERYTSNEIDRLHRRCVRAVEKMSRAEMRLSLSHYVRDTMLSEASLDDGNGWEEVLSFLDWVDGGME